MKRPRIGRARSAKPLFRRLIEPERGHSIPHRVLFQTQIKGERLEPMAGAHHSLEQAVGHRSFRTALYQLGDARTPFWDPNPARALPPGGNSLACPDWPASAVSIVGVEGTEGVTAIKRRASLQAQ